MLRASTITRHNASRTLRLITTWAKDTSGEPSFAPKPKLPKLFSDGTLTSTSTHSDRSSVSVAALAVWGTRQRAARLRKAGNLNDAFELLENGGVRWSKDPADLMEYFMTLRDCWFDGPREMLDRFRVVLDESPARKVTAVRNMQLSVYVKAARNASGDAAEFKREVVNEGIKLWRVMTERDTQRDMGADQWTLSLMYRLLGECKAADLIGLVGERATYYGISPGLHGMCERILCLGKCGRSYEAESEFFGKSMEKHRNHILAKRVMLRAHLASNRITKAEGLLTVHGPAILDFKSCNDYLRTCLKLELRNQAESLIVNMQRWRRTKYPPPNAESYNIFVKVLCRARGVEDSKAVIDRALQVLHDMRAQNIVPSTSTYNSVLRSLVAQEEHDEAMRLYEKMPEPDHNTFTILMTGADFETANRLADTMVQMNIQPRYGLVKALLNIYAQKFGTDTAFDFAKDLVKKFGDSIQFEKVGGQEAVRMALIHACGSAGDVSKAFAALLVKLSDSNTDAGNLAPMYTATSVMQACFKNGAVGKGLELFLSMKNAGVKLNYEVYESVIYGMMLGNEKGDEPLPGLLDLSLILMKEMHDVEAARSSRKATYLYNTLISAAAKQGNLYIAYQIFAKMMGHTNLRVVYFARKRTPLADLTGALFEKLYSFPMANTATYNTMIHALGLTNQVEEALRVYDTMATDPYNEPDDQTYCVLADIVIAYNDKARAQELLRTLDFTPTLTTALQTRRAELRVFLLKSSSSTAVDDMTVRGVDDYQKIIEKRRQNGHNTSSRTIDLNRTCEYYFDRIQPEGNPREDE